MNRIHAGEFLLNAYIKPMGLTNKQVSDALGVSCAAVSRLINGKSSVSVDMAIRLSKAFTTSPERWLNIQMKHDINNNSHDFSGVKCLYSGDDVIPKV